MEDSLRNPQNSKDHQTPDRHSKTSQEVLCSCLTGPEKVWSTVGSLWITLDPTHPRADQLQWDVGNLETRLPPWALYQVPQIIPEHFSLCCPAMRGCSYSTLAPELCQIAYIWVPDPKDSQRYTALELNDQCYSLDRSVAVMLWLIGVYKLPKCSFASSLFPRYQLWRFGAFL